MIFDAKDKKNLTRRDFVQNLSASGAGAAFANVSAKETPCKVILEILNPRGVLHPEPVVGLSNPRVTDLNGKRIALMSEKPDAVLFFNSLEKLLKKKYPDATILRFDSPANPARPDNTAEVASQCDVWLQGVKTTTSSKVDYDIKMEKLGRPGAMFCVDTLMKQRKRLADANGMPTLRIIPISSVSFFSAKGSQKLMDPVAAEVFDATVKALTEPLSAAEKNPPAAVYDYGPLQFTGDTYADAAESFQQYFADNFMHDGLPVVPPTPEAIKWMLKGTSRSPKEKIGVLPPRDGEATIEKIAINSVMAGAKPEYLPVIITALECITDKSFNSYHIAMGPLPVIWISGPIAREIGMNLGIGYLSPGFRANSTIGRAISLCMINIGWRLMDTDAMPGGPGTPVAYCNYLIPENDKESPWESFSVEHGYQPEDSTVSVNEMLQLSQGPGEGLSSQSLEEALDRIAKQLISFLNYGFPPENRRCEIFLYPTLARQLADAGYTKQSLVKALIEKSSIPWEKLSLPEQEMLKNNVAYGSLSGVKPSDLKPGYVYRTYRDPSQIAILVAGDAGGSTLIFSTACGSTARQGDSPAGFQDRPFMTKKIRGATLTKSGR